MSFWKKSDLDLVGKKQDNAELGKAYSDKPEPSVASGIPTRATERQEPASSESSLGSGNFQQASALKTPDQTPVIQRSAEDFLSDLFGPKLRAALGPGTIIQGKLSFDTPVRIDGRLTGEVFSTKALIIGGPGSVDAKLEVDSLFIMGQVKGSIIASDRVHIFAGGSFQGDLVAKTLVVEEGGKLEGSSQMGESALKSAREKFKSSLSESYTKLANQPSKTAAQKTTSDEKAATSKSKTGAKGSDLGTEELAVTQ